MASQIPLFISEYERLLEQRDFAAYRALGAITSAIVSCKQNDPKSALHVLTQAVAQYEKADAALQALKVSTKKENRHVVIRSQSAA